MFCVRRKSDIKWKLFNIITCRDICLLYMFSCSVTCTIMNIYWHVFLWRPKTNFDTSVTGNIFMRIHMNNLTNIQQIWNPQTNAGSSLRMVIPECVVRPWVQRPRITSPNTNKQTIKSRSMPRWNYTIYANLFLISKDLHSQFKYEAEIVRWTFIFPCGRRQAFMSSIMLFADRLAWILTWLT